MNFGTNFYQFFWKPKGNTPLYICIVFKVTRTIQILFILSLANFGRAQSITLEEEYDRLTDSWLEVSEVLKEYQGLSDFCIDPKFRDYTVVLLKQLHHYDSVVLDFLHDPATAILLDQKEYNKTMKDISKFESKYGIRDFISFLNESCITRNTLEKNKKDLVYGQGADSYDGQIIVLESDLVKFLKHIDKRIVSIDEHLHKIHPDKFQNDYRLTLTE